MEEQQYNIDDIFRQSLGDYREAPPPAAWGRVARRLDGDAGRRRSFLRWPWAALTLLALIGGGAALIAALHRGGNDTGHSYEAARSDAKQQTILPSQTPAAGTPVITATSTVSDDNHFTQAITTEKRQLSHKAAYLTKTIANNPLPAEGGRAGILPGPSPEPVMSMVGDTGMMAVAPAAGVKPAARIPGIASPAAIKPITAKISTTKISTTDKMLQDTGSHSMLALPQIKTASAIVPAKPALVQKAAPVAASIHPDTAKRLAAAKPARSLPAKATGAPVATQMQLHPATARRATVKVVQSIKNPVVADRKPAADPAHSAKVVPMRAAARPVRPIAAQKPVAAGRVAALKPRPARLQPAAAIQRSEPGKLPVTAIKTDPPIAAENTPVIAASPARPVAVAKTISPAVNPVKQPPLAASIPPPAVAPATDAVPTIRAQEPVVAASVVDTPANISRKKYPAGLSLAALAGYEFCTGSAGAGRITGAARLLWHVSPKVAIGLQPAYRYGTIPSTEISAQKAYQRSTTDVSSFISFDASPSIRAGVDTIYHYVIHETFDSIVVGSVSAGGGMWEIELPLILSYKPGRAWQVYGGPSLSFGGTISTGSAGAPAVYSTQRKDSIVQSVPIPESGFANYFGRSSLEPYSNYLAANDMPKDPASVRVGYLLGIGYEWNRIIFDASVHQQLSGYTDVAAPLRQVYASPYIRLALGYTLFPRKASPKINAE